jgi:hypothetical protein
MTQRRDSRLNLSGTERELLNALNRHNVRWKTAAALAESEGMTLAVVTSALNNLRRRELVTAHAPFAEITRWSITTLGVGELDAGTQLRLAPGGGYRHV